MGLKTVAQEGSLHEVQSAGERRVSVQLLAIETSYRTSDLAFREKLKSLDVGRLTASLGQPKEFAVLSTCNRFEVYLATPSPDATYTEFLEAVRSQTGLRADSAFSPLIGVEAARHLFMVAAGLDSVVIGEPQVLSQVRGAGIEARKRGNAKGILSPLFDRATRAGSKVRSKYGLGSGEASLSTLAVDAVDRLMPGRFDAMLIGSGKMIQLAARRLKGRARKVYVASRRRALGGFEGGEAISYGDIGRTASRCDVLIAATTAKHPLVLKSDLRGRKKRVVVDLGMPRNVSPSVRELPNVHLINLDDLAKIARPPKTLPQLKEAELTISQEASEFYDWLVQTRLSSTLANLYAWANEVREEELERARGKLQPKSAREARILDAMGRRIVSKLMARPADFARRENRKLDEDDKLELLGAIFGLGDRSEN